MRTLGDNLFFGLGAKLDVYQRDYVEAMLNYQAVFCNARAGTGKTTLAVAAARYLTDSKVVDGLLYVFNPVEEDKMGFRPGNQAEKEAEYLVPLKDALAEIGDMPDKAMDAKHGWVQARSHIFARGTNIQRKLVICEEAQNWTVPQLKKLYTRCHDDCIIVTIGHVGQIDLKNPRQSGFEKYMYHFRQEEYARICHLHKNYRGKFANHADELEEAV